MTVIRGILATRLEPEVTQGLRLVEKGDDFITVAWDDTGDADSWDVYLDSIFVENVLVPQYTFSALTGLTAYSIQVSSRNSEGASDLTAALEVTTLEDVQPVPDKPTGLTLDELQFAFAVLTWDAGSNVAEWDVKRDGVVIDTVTEPLYTDGAVTPGAEYDYEIVAKNAAGPSVPSDPLTVTMPANSPPDWTMLAQSGVVGDAFSFDLNLECNDADGHTLTYTKTGGDVPGGTLVGSIFSGTYTQDGTFNVEFTADDGFDQTVHTVTFTIAALPDTTAPSVPGNRTVVVAGASATFDWDESTDASGIWSYRLRKGSTILIQDIGGVAFESGSPGAVAGPPVTLTGLPNGTYADYNVRSFDNSPARNFSAQGFFPSFTINVAPPAPDVPINFVVNATSSTATASTWQPGPNGPAPTRYTIERHDGTVSNADAQNPLAAGWTEVFNALATSDTDTGLNPLTTYTYRIRAYNVSEGSIGYAVATVTTQASSGVVWPGISAKQSGLLWYSGAGSVGYPSGNGGGNIANFQGLTGHPMDLLTEWTGQQGASTWAEYEQGGTTKFQNAMINFPDNKPIVHIWPLLANTEDGNFTRWEQLRDGDFDSHIHTAMAAMRSRVLAQGRALNTIIFDLGHEMSGTWYAWSIIAGATKLQAFKDAWCHTVDIIRQYFPTSLICFRPARRRGGTGEGGTPSRTVTFAQMVPPNTHVDLYGRSFHDENPHVNRNDPNSFNRHVDSALAAADNNIGMNDVFSLARTNGKKVLIAEWGTQISYDGGSHEPNVFGPTNGTAYWYERAYEMFYANRDVLLAETVFQPGDSRLWGTRSNTATDPDLSARHEAAKAAYNASTRWGAD